MRRLGRFGGSTNFALLLQSGCWTRLALLEGRQSFVGSLRIPLASIGPAQAERALESGDLNLEARIRGAAEAGGPAFATVPLLAGGSTVRSRNPLRT